MEQSNLSYDPIELARNKSDVLVIHPPQFEFRSGVNEKMRELGIERFDRLSFPSPSETLIREDLVTDWIKLLLDKHHFETAHLMDDGNKTNALGGARHILKIAIPDLQVTIHELNRTEISGDVDTLVYTCADPRFQTSFSEVIEHLGISRYDLMAGPGPSKTIDSNPETVKWIQSLVKDTPTIQRLVVLNHIDCGALGGLKKFRYNENAEAAVHQEHQRNAEVRLASKIPSLQVKTYILGIDGAIDMSKIDPSSKVGIRT